MEGYITKPIDFDLLFYTMSNLLSKELVEKSMDEVTVKVDPEIKQQIIQKIIELKQYEIYETEKLMDSIVNIESSLLNSSSNSILNNQILDLKGAILEGDESKMSKISDEITVLMNS